MSSLKIFLVEDELAVRTSLQALCRGHRLEFFESALDLAETESEDPDLVLMDLCSPKDPDGAKSIDLIPALRRRFALSEFVIQSGVEDAARMRACIRAGADRFVSKTHLREEIEALIARQQEITLLRDELAKTIVGDSVVMRQLRRDLLKLRLQASVDVLIEGETGSGKELCAQALHAGNEPFVAINASAIPADLFEAEFFGAEKGSYTGANAARIGHFEAAGSGTVFIDEVQSLSLAHQSKLLRVLETRRFLRVGSSQERPFRARVVSASNRNLREEVAKGNFREDLYYRLAPISVAVPPLRARQGDIPKLAQLFLRDFDTVGSKRFTPNGLRALEANYDWPGNVRELRGFVRKVVLKSEIPLLDAPEIENLLAESDVHVVDPGTASSSTSGSKPAVAHIDPTLGFDGNIAHFEKVLLEHALLGRSTTEARDFLQMPRSRFYEKLKIYGLKT